MGNRLTRIVTRTGDGGETGLADGTRIEKDSERIASIGDIDELNSAIGVVLGHQLSPRVRTILIEIQHELFNLGGELAMPETAVITEADVLKLEGWIASFNDEMPALKEFILPSGQAPVGAIHLARAICRRAERSIVSLGRSEPGNPATRVYLNRLSDLLFVMARTVARESGAGEVYWHNPTRLSLVAPARRIYLPLPEDQPKKLVVAHTAITITSQITARPKAPA